MPIPPELAVRLERREAVRLKVPATEPAPPAASAPGGSVAAHKEAVRQRALAIDPAIWRQPAAHADAVTRAFRAAIAEEPDLPPTEQERLFQELVSETLGWGLIDRVMQDPTVTEVIIDRPDSVGYLRDGQFHWLTEDYPHDQGPRVRFASADDLRHWLERVLRTSDRQLTYEHPLLDADVGGGARLQATGEPVSEGITVNLRKSVAQTRLWHPDDYVRQGVWSADLVRFLLAAVAGHANLIVAGPTASGKTTIIRMLIEHGIHPMERVISIEDIRETRARHPRFLSLMTVDRRQNPIGFAELFRATLRKSPNRVLVSEIRGPEETVAFFRTIAAGHPGVLTSMHGNGPNEIVAWLVAYAVQGGLASIPDLVRQLVYDSLHLIVFIRLLPDGRRRVTGVYECVPAALQPTIGTAVRPLFLWDRQTDTHRWVADPLPEHREEWEFYDVDVPSREDAACGA